VEHGRDV
jgi:hypothetical protein